MGRRVPVLWLPLIGFLLAAGLVAALGRDLDGRYAGSPLKRWFDQLESGWGRCCSDADGRIVEDADWETKDGHYRVRVPNVPGEAVRKSLNTAPFGGTGHSQYANLGGELFQVED